MNTVNVALVGIGNCASSLVQGIQYYRQPGCSNVGLTNPVCAKYGVADVRVTAAFDVDVNKVGRDVSEAISIAPNNSLAFAEVPALNVLVSQGILADGVGPLYAQKIEARGDSTVDEVAEVLRDSKCHVVVNFLPVGSQEGTEKYAEAALRAGCAFVNCIPTTLARAATWRSRFESAGLPLIGDDLKSQFGSTLLHHALIDALMRNGVTLRSTYQIVGGGNMDFLNMQDAERVKTKTSSKVAGMFGGKAATLSADDVHFGAEYMPFLRDRKLGIIRVDGMAFGGTSINVELRMEVEDSPSAAGNVLDAVRYAKSALDRGLGGVFDPAASLLMKAPPRPLLEAEARDQLHKLFEA
jgi:myo-inositol-1-phosphate synthase